MNSSFLILPVWRYLIRKIARGVVVLGMIAAVSNPGPARDPWTLFVLCIATLALLDLVDLHDRLADPGRAVPPYKPVPPDHLSLSGQPPRTPENTD